jgi:hypothetical protein
MVDSPAEFLKTNATSDDPENNWFQDTLECEPFGSFIPDDLV